MAGSADQLIPKGGLPGGYSVIGAESWAPEPWRVASTITFGQPQKLVRPGFGERGEADAIQAGLLSPGFLGQQRAPAVYKLNIGFRQLKEIFHGV